MWTHLLADLGPEPRLFSTAQLGTRTDRLSAKGAVVPVIHGHWAVHHRPLTTVERSLLLPRVVGTSESRLAMTGFPALEYFGAPAGSELSWTRDALTKPSASGRGSPARRYWWCPPRALVEQRGGRRLHELAGLPHAAWDGARVRYRGRDAMITRKEDIAWTQTSWNGRVVHPLEALLVVSPWLARWRLVACVDHLLTYRFLRPGVTGWQEFTKEHLFAFLQRQPSNAVRTLTVQRALELATAPVLSPMETLIRLMVRVHGIADPVVNLPVEIGGRIFYLDLAWPEVGIAVEYNGEIHSGGHEHYQHEMYRLSLLRDAGWDVTVLTTADVRSPIRRAAWLDRLRRAGLHA